MVSWQYTHRIRNTASVVISSLVANPQEQSAYIRPKLYIPTSLIQNTRSIKDLHDIPVSGTFSPDSGHLCVGNHERHRPQKHARVANRRSGFCCRSDNIDDLKRPHGKIKTMASATDTKLGAVTENPMQGPETERNHSIDTHDSRLVNRNLSGISLWTVQHRFRISPPAAPAGSGGPASPVAQFLSASDKENRNHIFMNENRQGTLPVILTTGLRDRPRKRKQRRNSSRQNTSLDGRPCILFSRIVFITQTTAATNYLYEETRNSATNNPSI